MSRQSEASLIRNAQVEGQEAPFNDDASRSCVCVSFSAYLCIFCVYVWTCTPCVFINPLYVSKPEEAIHLMIVEKAFEVDSSDGGSEESSDDDDDDEDDEDEDDDDDDDDDGGDDDDDD